MVSHRRIGMSSHIGAEYAYRAPEAASTPGEDMSVKSASFAALVIGKFLIAGGIPEPRMA